MARWRRSDRRSTLQYVIRLARVTGSMTKVHHQVSQSNWLDGRGLGEELSKTPDKKSPTFRNVIRISQSLSRATTRSTRWKLSETVQSMPKKQTDTFQGYTIWLHKKVTRKSTWEPFSAVMHLWKMVSTFYKDDLENSKATSASLNSAPPMAKSTIQLLAKQKRGQLTRRAKKRAK